MKKFILFAFIVFVSCNSDNQQSQKRTIQVNIDNEVSGYKSVDLFTKIEVVKLGLVKNKAVGQIQKILEFDSNYYLLESSGITGGRIICINKEGEIQKFISKQGKGPGEYLYLIDFDINRLTGELYLLDNYNRKILVYTHDFIFDRVIETNNVIPLNLISYWEESNSFLINKGNGRFISEYDFHFIEFSADGSIQNKRFPVNKIYNQSLGGMWRAWEVANTVHYLPPFSNTIYSINHQGEDEFLTFSFNKNTIDYETYIATKNLENTVYNRKFIEGKSHLFLTFMYNGEVFTSIVDKKLDRSILVKNESDPTCGCGQLIKPINFCNDEIILMANNLNINLILDIIDPGRKKIIRDNLGVDGIDTSELKEQVLVFAKMALK